MVNPELRLSALHIVGFYVVAVDHRNRVIDVVLLSRVVDFCLRGVPVQVDSVVLKVRINVFFTLASHLIAVVRVAQLHFDLKAPAGSTVHIVAEAGGFRYFGVEAVELVD